MINADFSYGDGEILRDTAALNSEAETLLKEAIQEYTEQFLATLKK